MTKNLHKLSKGLSWETSNDRTKSDSSFESPSKTVQEKPTTKVCSFLGNGRRRSFCRYSLSESVQQTNQYFQIMFDPGDQLSKIIRLEAIINTFTFRIPKIPSFRLGIRTLWVDFNFFNKFRIFDPGAIQRVWDDVVRPNLVKRHIFVF